MSATVPDARPAATQERTEAAQRPRSTPTRAVVAALLRKELRVELRTLGVGAGHVAVQRDDVRACSTSRCNRNSVDGDLAAGVLWVTLLFAAILGVNRLFVADAEQGGFDAFLLSPVDRSALLLAQGARRCSPTWSCSRCRRAGVRRCCCCGPRSATRCPACSRVLALADLGVAAIGTLVARARRAHARARPARPAAGAAAARAGRDRRRARDARRCSRSAAPRGRRRAGC